MAIYGINRQHGFVANKTHPVWNTSNKNHSLFQPQAKRLFSLRTNAITAAANLLLTFRHTGAAVFLAKSVEIVSSRSRIRIMPGHFLRRAAFQDQVAAELVFAMRLTSLRDVSTKVIPAVSLRWRSIQITQQFEYRTTQQRMCLQYSGLVILLSLFTTKMMFRTTTTSEKCNRDETFHWF